MGAPLQPEAILAALGVLPATTIAPVHGGTATALWRVNHGATTSALRVFHPGEEAICRREVEAMEAARAAGVPVPAVRAYGMWHERPALLLSWLPGVPIWQAIRERPGRVWPLGLAFGRMHASIHRIQPPAQWPDAPHDWIGWYGPHEQGLTAALQSTSHTAPRLLHLDYHPLNVLTDGTRITAVLDWANTRPGDPRADVARTYTILMVEPYMPNREPPELWLARRVFAWAWRRGYRQAGGVLTDMEWFYVWAGLVMLRDLDPRVDNPESWWQPQHLARIQVWTAYQKRRSLQTMRWKQAPAPPQRPTD